MKRDVLGASQPSLPLGRNVRYGVAGPIVNAATYNTRRGNGSHSVREEVEEVSERRRITFV